MGEDNLIEEVGEVVGEVVKIPFKIVGGIFDNLFGF